MSKPPRRAGIFARYGGTISRDTAIYAVGMAMVFPFSLIQAILFTRFMAPSEYGDLAILLTIAGFLTIIMTIGTLHGTFVYVYRAGSDDGGDDGGLDLAVDDGEEGDGRPEAYALNKRRALTTGAGLTLASMGITTLVVMIFSAPLGDLFLGERADAGKLIIWACLSAVAGGLWRFVHNVLRLELRPMLWVFFNTLRPTLVVGIAVALIATGGGIVGALIGTTVGTAITTALCLAMTIGSYTLRFSGSDARAILSRSKQYAVINIALWVIGSGDVLLLSRFVSSTDVGLYRLAGRFASVPQYFVGAFLMALVPLERTPLFSAVYERFGQAAVRTRLFTYYLVIALGIALVLSVCADLLVLLAAPSYRDASDLVGPITVATVFASTFALLFRWTAVSLSKRNLRLILVVSTAIVFAATSAVLGPILGSYSPVVALVVSTGSAIVVILRVADPEESVQVLTRHNAIAFSAAIGCWAIGTRLADVTGPAHATLGVLSLIAYPAIMIATGTIPLSGVRVLRDAGREAAVRKRRRGNQLVARIGLLPVRHRVAIEALVREKRRPAEVAATERISEEELGAWLVRGLRQLASIEDDGQDDVDIGRYLLMEGPHAARSAMARHLQENEVDMLKLHDYDEALVALRSVRSRAWRAHDTLSLPAPV